MAVSAPALPLSLELGPDLDEITRVLAAIDALSSSGAIREAVAYALKLAADEVLMNILHHGGGAAGDPKVRLRLELGGGRARLEISDAGPPFDPLAAPPPDTLAPLADRRVGGLGIHLVRKLMDEVHYQRAGDRNVLIMIKQMET